GGGSGSSSSSSSSSGGGGGGGGGGSSNSSSSGGGGGGGCGLLLTNERPLVRFRRAGRTVLLILKATASSRHASQHKETQVSWTQLADEHSTAKRTYDLFGISFDPTVFKAKREKFLSTEAKAILSLYPSDRTNEQVKLVVLSLNQTVDAFGEFPIRLQRSLARFRNKTGHNTTGAPLVTLLETDKDTGDQCVRTVAILKSGNSFGELALMHGARRSATVTCKTNVELLAVSREDFIDIFMHIEKDREPEHIRFLRSIDLLRGWPLDQLPHDNPRICLFTFFRRGVLLCKDSNTSEWIYVIKSGTCRVLKDLYDTKPNIPGLERIPYSIDQTYIKLPPIPHSHDSSTPRDDHHESHAGPSKVFVQIQKLLPKDVFGLEQAVFGLIGQTTSCSLVSDGAECVLINKKFFTQHLTDSLLKHLRRTIQPIPTEKSLQQKLQDQANWDAYKTMTVSNFIVLSRQLHEHQTESLFL
ncbi:CNBD2-like protein, partial [Mya arenaria]